MNKCILPDSVDMHFKGIRQTFKSEMEVCMGTIFNCITPCGFGSNILYYPSVRKATGSDTQLQHQHGMAQSITFGA